MWLASDRNAFECEQVLSSRLGDGGQGSDLDNQKSAEGKWRLPLPTQTLLEKQFGIHPLGSVHDVVCPWNLSLYLGQNSQSLLSSREPTGRSNLRQCMATKINSAPAERLIRVTQARTVP